MKYFITGITGQLGKFLTELLVEKDHKVFGMVRRSSTVNTSRIEHLLDKIELLSGDLTDESSLITCLEKSQPDIVINAAAQSFVAVSWIQPELTMNVNALGTIRLLEAIRKVNPKIRFVGMSSSEMFGSTLPPQNENTLFHPRSIYGVSKVAAHYATINYRESYGMFCSNAIAFNYESSARGVEFVTKRITEGVKKIVQGKTTILRLGNTKAKRDWSYAGDVAEAVYLIANHSNPDDFCICSGECHSVEEFLEIAFRYYNMDWQDYVIIDSDLIRPAEVNVLHGDSTKIRKILGWKPKVNFQELVKIMIETELSLVK